ncbi:MAG TPA: DUF3014 domain-containing protein [Vicinamibacterales bacterium]|jgi:hypothetical protein
MDLHDYELGKPDEPVDIEPIPPRNRGVWIAVAAVVILGAIAVFVFYNRRPAPAPAAAVAPPPAAPTRPLGGQPEAVTVPPLDESDPVVRDLVRALSSNPQVLAWLTTNGLIRNFAVVVANVVEGVTPANHLHVLRPRTAFQADERGSEILLDPRSYNRYDTLADAIASIDPAGASRLYATLKPRIQEAYAELGMRPASFDAALEHAFIVLLQVPIVDGPVRLEPKGIGYRYADPKLEELTGAQKQLLRMGPRNVRAVQASLRRLAVALGIPEERLP